MNKHHLKKLTQCPSAALIKFWVKKSESEGEIGKKAYSARLKPVRTENVVDAVKQVVTKNPSVSQRRMSSATGVSKTTIQRILKQDLKLHPYKFQTAQNLSEEDHFKRLNFAIQMEESFNNFNNIIFSDEAHLYLNGIVN